MNLDSLKQDTLENADSSFKAVNVPEVSIKTILEPPNAVVGDTLVYKVEVSVEASAVLPLIAQNSVNAKGISQQEIQQVSSRKVSDGKTVSSTEFVYKLTVTDTGSLTIPKLIFMLPNEQGESVSLETKPYSFYAEQPFNFLPVFAGVFCAIAILGVAFFKRKKGVERRFLKQKENENKEKVLEGLRLLKARLNVADSREWLQDLESVLNDYCKWKYEGLTFMQCVKTGVVSDASDLAKLLSEARYGGGNQDVFENRETFKRVLCLTDLVEEFKDFEN